MLHVLPRCPKSKKSLTKELERPKTSKSGRKQVETSGASPAKGQVTAVAALQRARGPGKPVVEECHEAKRGVTGPVEAVRALLFDVATLNPELESSTHFQFYVQPRFNAGQGPGEAITAPVPFLKRASWKLGPRPILDYSLGSYHLDFE